MMDKSKPYTTLLKWCYHCCVLTNQLKGGKMSKVIRARTMDRASPTVPRLKDFGNEHVANLDNLSVYVVDIDFQDNDATRRMVMHAAKRVIRQHKDEIQELSYK